MTPSFSLSGGITLLASIWGGTILETIALAVMVGGLGLPTVSYLIHPLIVLTAARMTTWTPLAFDDAGDAKTDHRTTIPFPDPPPKLALVIAAHNEQGTIAARLDNALATDYPPDRLLIVVASDGSTDGTNEIVADYQRRWGPHRIQLRAGFPRRGKAANLNDAVAALPEDIDFILFSDANTFYQPQAARRLIRWFADKSIGTVCGKLILVDSVTGRNLDSLYWRYETAIKTAEGRLGALLGANGAIYAMRKADYRAIPAETIVDDFVIPLISKLETRRLIWYDPEAIAIEETPPNLTSEFRRRARIGAGGFQSLAWLVGLIHPRHGWTAWCFLAHKVARWLTPFGLIAALVANLPLAARDLSSPFGVTLAIQGGFYGLAVLGAWLPNRPRWLKPARLATLFVAMNLALLVGFGRWIRGIQAGTWTPTQRSLAETQQETK